MCTWIVTNNINPRTHYCIALRTTKNIKEIQMVIYLDIGSFLKISKIITMVLIKYAHGILT